jgi:hypothetical protein
MSRTTKYLLEQIERAKRFAGALNNPADRASFEKIAADYQKELDAAAASSGEQQPSAATETASSDPIPSTSEAAPSDAIAPEGESPPTSTDDQQATKD